MEFQEAVASYLEELYGTKVKIIDIRPLGETQGEEVLKGFGYGRPYLLVYELGGQVREAVLSSMRVQGGFGHDYPSDRAQILLEQHRNFNRLPRHARSLDIGYFTKDGELHSAGKAEEYFILMEKVEGKEYYLDLEQIKKRGRLVELDRRRVVALAEYLAEIHSTKHDNRQLYYRKIRDTIGHGECIFGLTDSYPEGSIPPEVLCEIEKKCVEWRWKLRNKYHRLSVTHGDFHPWNILFRQNTDFTVLDRSRGEYGEPADDVSSLTINYLFYSLQQHGKLTGAFQELYELFFETYLEKTRDFELLEVIQPFYVFRGLVVASPVWYPVLPRGVREKIFNFIHNILETKRFDYREVNSLI